MCCRLPPAARHDCSGWTSARSAVRPIYSRQSIEGDRLDQSAIAAHRRAPAVLQRGSGDRRDRARLPRSAARRRRSTSTTTTAAIGTREIAAEAGAVVRTRTAAGQGPRRPAHVRRHRRRHLRDGRRRPDLRSRRPRRRWSTCCSPSSSTWSSAPGAMRRRTPIAAATCSGTSIFTGLLSGLFGRSFSDIFSGYRVFSRRFVKSFPVLSSGFEIETEMSVHALELQDAGRRGRDELRRAARGFAFQALHLFGRLADPEDDSARSTASSARCFSTAASERSWSSPRSCSRFRWS